MKYVVLAAISAVASAMNASLNIKFAATNHTPITGRAFVFLATSSSAEPRTLIGDDITTAQFFGVDVTTFRAGDTVTLDASTLGYPITSLSLIPAMYGSKELMLQAVIQPYKRYKLKDAPPVWLPRTEVNRFEGGDIFTSPGTFYSKPIKVTLGEGSSHTLVVDQQDAPAPEPPPLPKDTIWIKHVRVTSRLLSEFWGEPVQLEACVLLPWQFYEKPDVKFPTFLYHGHYHEDWATPAYFSTKPAPAGLTGYALVQAQYAYALYQNWTSSDGPFRGARGLIVTVKHPNPYYDDSYAVNSANLGPYGDAIMSELLPEVEARYRGIGEGWARATYGGSMGGWESLAVQVFYPDAFNGCWTFCPDPVSFDRYTTVDIYKDENAYYATGPWKRVPRPAIRDAASNGIWRGNASTSYGSPFGHVVATQEEVNLKELVKGTKARSCDQWDIWQAVFGPRAADGYVQPIWDKRTGVINRTVATYWRDHFDLTHILARDWATLGPKLQGKMHLFVGMSDTYYLNDAVYSLQDFLDNPATSPPSGATFDFGEHDGRGYEHCYSGNHGLPNSLGRLTINARVLPAMAARMAATAPAGADLRWNEY